MWYIPLTEKVFPMSHHHSQEVATGTLISVRRDSGLDNYNFQNMEKQKMTAHIECNNTGFYTVYCEEELPFGIFGEGFSAEEAKKDFLELFEAMNEDHFQRTGVKVDAEFTFVYDASAFLQHYKGILTLAGMSRMTGINKAQLSQYVCGKRHPSARTQEKIRRSVKKFAEELSRAMLLLVVFFLLSGLNCANAQSTKWIAKGDQAIEKSNYAKAKKCYDKAITSGEKGAYYKMGLLLSEGPENLHDEEVAALCLYQDASKMSIDKLQEMSDRNSQDAQMLLGYCYQEGVVVQKDLSKAIELYKKAEKFNLVFLIDALQRRIDSGEEDKILEKDDTPLQLPMDSIFLISETMPEFPGGENAFIKTLSNVITCPEYTLRNRISGTVLVEFVVEKDGSVDNAKIKLSAFPLLDNEALRGMTKLPKWKPGTFEGKPVRCFFQVPITFIY